MNCAAITSDDLLAIAELVALMSVCSCFLGLCVFKVSELVCEAVVNRLRKRGAAAPFAQRAEAAERRVERSVALWVRIAQRNRREAERRQ